MQEFKEHWVQIRTPEQFSIFYDCCQEVADLAKAKMAPMLKSKVDGFTDFKKSYEIPEIYLEVDNFMMTLSDFEDPNPTEWPNDMPEINAHLSNEAIMLIRSNLHAWLCDAFQYSYS